MESLSSVAAMIIRARQDWSEGRIGRPTPRRHDSGILKYTHSTSVTTTRLSFVVVIVVRVVRVIVVLADAPNEQLVNISRNWAGIDDITNHG